MLDLSFDFFDQPEDDESEFLRSEERTYFDVEDGAGILSRRAELPAEGEIVIETSSNFNENPKIEQFCITNSPEIYGFYKAGLFGA